jgi:D-3-phosphoglycerate dehydrogenase
MARILICDPIRGKALEILGENNEVVNRPQIERDEILNLIGDFHALVVRARTKVDSEILSRAKNLQVIARAGVGTDNIDVDKATEMGILVVNSPDPSITPVAEHVYALLLSVLRRVPTAHASLLRGEWRKSDLMGGQLEGKWLGIIGLGRIGTKVAKIAKGFNISVLATDPYASEEYAHEIGADLVEIEDLLRKSDFITLHVPLTQSTRDLIGERELEMMKTSAILINTSRAEVVAQDALVDALQSGRIAGAGLDVFDRSSIEELSACRNLVLTPHLGASTTEAQSEIAEAIAEEVLDALQGRPTRNPVNMPYIDRKSLDRLQPYLDLTHKLVSVLSRFVDDRPKTLSLSLMGKASELENAEFLLRTFALGILSQFHEVNVVNAMTAAERMGIETEIARISGGGAYLSCVELSVQTAADTFTAKGALLDTNKPRIVGLAGYDLEFVPEGNLLITEHLDVPGMVGIVGTKLGSAEINIATMEVSRRKMGDLAIMVIQTDREVPADLAGELRSIKGMRRVETLNL